MAMINEYPRVLGWTPRKLMGIQFLSTGSYLPPRVVTNDELAARLGFDADWIFQRSGILERRHAAPEMATSATAANHHRRGGFSGTGGSTLGLAATAATIWVLITGFHSLPDSRMPARR